MGRGYEDILLGLICDVCLCRSIFIERNLYGHGHIELRGLDVSDHIGILTFRILGHLA